MEPSSREIGAPLAGWLLVVAGGLTVLNNHLPGAETLDRGVLNLLGGLAVLLGTTSFMLPWRPRGAGGRRTGQARHRHRWRRGRRRRTCPAAGVPAARGGRKDGSVLWATAKASQLEGPGQRSGGTLATVADATARKATEDELRRPALVDELTGLRNRRGFLAVAEHLAQVAQRTGKNMALVYIDLDNMKEINDRFGHSAGDRALVETAEILRSTFRKSDVLGRFGGDEFCVLMAPDGAAVESALERLTASLAARGPDASPPLSLSLGVATFDAEASPSIMSLITQADAAMYQDKSRKRGAGR